MSGEAMFDPPLSDIPLISHTYVMQSSNWSQDNLPVSVAAWRFQARGKIASRLRSTELSLLGCSNDE